MDPVEPGNGGGGRGRSVHGQGRSIISVLVSLHRGIMRGHCLCMPDQRKDGSWLVRVLGGVFGRVSWSPPPWLAWCFRRIFAVLHRLRRHPRATLFCGLAIAALVVGGVQCWRWWQSHKPRELPYNVVRQVEVKVSQPPAAVAAGAPDKDLSPSPMQIAFSGAPVAPLEKIGKDAGDAVRLDPALPGKWTWLDGSTLGFQPENHWPPGTKLTAFIEPSALAKDLQLDTTSVTTTTPPLVAEFHEFEFYNSPKDASVYQVVAELRLSHPVAIEMLREKMRMEVIGGTPVFTSGTPLFTVTADPLSVRKFFIRSRQIVVPLKEDWVKLVLPQGISSTLAGQPLAKDRETKTRVPDKYSGLRIEKAETKIIRTDEGEPQQFLFIHTNLVIDSAEIASRIGMWWHRDGWHDSSGNLIFDERVGSATQVALTPVESEAPSANSTRSVSPRHGWTEDCFCASAMA